MFTVTHFASPGIVACQELCVWILVIIVLTFDGTPYPAAQEPTSNFFLLLRFLPRPEIRWM